MLAALVISLLAQAPDPASLKGPIYSSAARSGSHGLCGQFRPSDRAGAWWCLNGDGTMAPGSQYAVSRVNAPSTVFYQAAKQTRLNPTDVSQDQYYASATRSAPAASLTACVLGTKADLTTADWLSFSDHAGTYSFLAEDNGTTVTMFGLSSSITAPSPSNFVEALVCLKYDAALKTGTVCVFDGDTISSGCNHVSVSNTSLTAGSLKWIVAGAQSGTAYNMRGFVHGAFLTEAALTDAEIARIAGVRLLGPPDYPVLWQDAAAVGSNGNDGVPHASLVTTWVSHGPTLSSFVAINDAGTPHLNSIQEASVSFDGVYDQSISAGSGNVLAFVNQTGVFDLALLLRRRATTVDGTERRIFGGSEGQAGLFLGFNGYANTEGTFWALLGNGTGLLTNYRSTLAAPLGVPYALLVRGDGANLKLSHNFTTFETVAFSGSPGGADAGFNYAIGAVSPADTAGVQFLDGDVFEVLLYSSNLNATRLANLKAYLDRQTVGVTTPTTWAAIGDSITEGATMNWPWPARVTSSLAPRVSVANLGKSGDTIAGITTRYGNVVAGQGYYGLIIMIGLNDLQAGTSASTIFASIQSLVATAKASGLTVVVSTVSPNNGYSGWDATKQAQWVLLNASIVGLTGVTILRSDLALADPVDATRLKSADDSGDGRHPNDNGGADEAAAVTAVIGAL